MRRFAKLKADLKWIPWHRYVLLLSIDKNPAINLGRFRLSISASIQANRLAAYKGYETEVVDTKED